MLKKKEGKKKKDAKVIKIQSTNFLLFVHSNI